MASLNYLAPPTCAAFMKSNAFGRIIAGPVGSGKTTACVIELLRRASEQAPGADGYRYSRFAVVRQTLKQLKDTVLKDCDTWLAANGLGQWKVSESTYHLQFNDVRSEWVFLPLEDAEDQGRLLSMQLTGAWLSECIEMDISILGPIVGRIGRYPSGNKGVATWHGIIADTNMPTEMTPWHEFMQRVTQQQVPDWQLFRQPGGMDPRAENLNWLLQTAESRKLPLDHPVRLAQGRKYYENIVSQFGADHPYVKRYVDAQYGDDPSGMAVFQHTFNPHFHIVDKTDLIPGYPLLLGQDLGRNPWTLICQNDPWGRLLVHEEVPATNIGLEKHILEHVRPRLMLSKYMGYKVAAVGDPAGIAKDSHSEENSFDLLKRLGLPAIPAPTNDIDPRLRSVEAFLGRQVNGGPALLINRMGCPKLCRAMSGGYRFTKTKQGALKPKPDKDDREGFSHVADCLQYVCLTLHGGMMPYVQRIINPQPRSSPKGRISPRGWT